MKWIDNLDGNVIVSDAQGIIIYMNETAIRNYAKDGGALDSGFKKRKAQNATNGTGTR